MKKILSMALSVAVSLAIATFAAAEIPAPWFDLDFADGAPVDKAGNAAEVNIMDGEVGDATFCITDEDGNDKYYSLTAFKGEMDAQALEVILPFDAAGEEWGQFLYAGHTVEALIQVDGEIPSGVNAAIVASCYGGGYGLYLHDRGSYMVQIGNNGAYSAATGMTAHYDNMGKFTHVIAEFNPDDLAIYLYVNGEIEGATTVEEGYMFSVGNAYADMLGIGLNASYPSENIGYYAPFSILDVNIYNVPLNDDQILEAYDAAIARVQAGTPAEAPETETEDVEDTDAAEDTDTETPAETDAETPAETDAETPAETDAETPAETDAETPAATDAETPAETDAETPAETDDPADDAEGGNTGIIIGIVAAVVVVIAVVAVVLAKKKKN